MPVDLIVFPILLVLLIVIARRFLLREVAAHPEIDSKAKPRPNDDVAIATFDGYPEAGMATERLRRAGIRSVLVPISEGGTRIGNAGPFELRVLARNADRAQQVLAAPARRRRRKISPGR